MLIPVDRSCAAAGIENRFGWPGKGGGETVAFC